MVSRSGPIGLIILVVSFRLGLGLMIEGWMSKLVWWSEFQTVFHVRLDKFLITFLFLLAVFELVVRVEVEANLWISWSTAGGWNLDLNLILNIS